jgi:hypothetical protein
MAPTLYRIRVKGHLRPEWSEWFDNMTITLEENDDTTLAGLVADQAALHGLLVKVRDLGLSLVSVNQGESNDESTVRLFSKHPLTADPADCGRPTRRD